MAESTVMAVARFCRAGFQSEQPPGFCKVVHKDFQTIKLGDALELEVPRSGLHLKSNHFDCYQNSPTSSSEFTQPAGPIFPTNNSVLIDVQDACPDTVLLSSGIAEQCERHEKIVRFLTSGSTYDGDLNLSALCDLMRLPTSGFPASPSHHWNGYFPLYEAVYDVDTSVLYPQKELYSPKALMDSIDDFSFDPRAAVHARDDVLFSCSDAEMKRWFATMAGFYLAKRYSKGIQRREMVVPYFRRSSRKMRGPAQGSLKFQDVAAPVKSSPEEIKFQPLPKRKKNKKGSEKHIDRNNYSYVCESLLSVVFSKNSDKNAYLSLKKNNHELFQLLTQFSAGIAGTGLAVLFSVLWKLGSGRAVASYTPRVLSTGLALSLFLLSSSVNALRDAVVESTKSLSNARLKENENMDRVERRAKEVFVRVAAVMAVAILRFV